MLLFPRARRPLANSRLLDRGFACTYIHYFDFHWSILTKESTAWYSYCMVSSISLKSTTFREKTPLSMVWKT